MPNKTAQLVREFLFLTLGTALVAVGVYFFKFPNNFSTGGVTGIAVIISAFVPGISTSTFASVLNLVFLALGFLVLNSSFGLRTTYCSLLFSGLLSLLDRLCPLEAPLTDQPLLELFFAVILPSLGSAILFNIGGSTGGTDILAMILKKFSSLDIGRALLCCDVLIAASTLVVYDIRTGLFSILGLLLKSLMVDSVIESLNRKKAFTVITAQPEIAIDFITHKLNRGATYWEAEGGYTHDRKYVVLAAVSGGQAVFLRRYLKEKDPKAFMLIENSSEIFGKGFMRV